MLGVRRDQVEVEVISEGSRGVLGFGAENAQVRLVVKPPPAPPPRQPVAEPQPAPLPSQITKPVPAPEAEKPATAQEPGSAPQSPTPEQIGREILTDLLSLMDIRASVQSHLGEELAEEGQPLPSILNITGDDLGLLIGRRGETLRALQYLVRLMVSHRLKRWSNLVVDVENYRVRRKRTLERLAQRVARDVSQSGRTQALEPMPAYDRRLVHVALRNHPQVTTRSVGEGERRKVTIIPRP
jgi:spoIIIJ-associated protein